MTDILSFEETGILPVVNIPSLEKALPLMRALLEGGIDGLEVTLRASHSLECIRRIKQAYPEVTVGAGTVLDIETAAAALAAGADFLVSPGYDPALVSYGLERQVPIIPGCTTASEIQAGLQQGLRLFKFFPAEFSGGVAALRLLSGPFPQARFLPTGGIGFDNLGDYLSLSAVAACGGSFVATAQQLSRDDYSGITAACRRAVDISLGFSLAHGGLNCSQEEAAQESARQLGAIFRLPVKDECSSVFVGSAVECMKTPGYGANGHIGFYTRSIPRALAYFARCGWTVQDGSAYRDENGQMVSVYLQQQVGGFAFHILQR